MVWRRVSFLNSSMSMSGSMKPSRLMHAAPSMRPRLSLSGSMTPPCASTCRTRCSSLEMSIVVETRKHSRAAARIALGGACSHQLRRTFDGALAGHHNARHASYSKRSHYGGAAERQLNRTSPSAVQRQARRLLLGRNIGRRLWARIAGQRLDVFVERPALDLVELVHVEPRHRRADGERLGEGDPVVLAHVGDGQAQVARVVGAPRSLVADRVAFQRLVGIDLATALGVTDGMAIVAAADDRDVLAELDRRRVRCECRSRKAGCLNQHRNPKHDYLPSYQGLSPSRGAYARLLARNKSSRGCNRRRRRATHTLRSR